MLASETGAEAAEDSKRRWCERAPVQVAAGNHEVGDVGAIGGEVSGGAGDGQEFSEASASIVEIVSESAESQAKGSGGKLYGAAILGAEGSASKQRGITDGFAGEGLAGGDVDEFERSGWSGEAARLG
jgi:hypothetical protein